MPSPAPGYGIHTIPGIAKHLEQKELCVIPAKAGIQETPQISGGCGWIPAFAGMTADKIALFQRLT
jgi:hypothetical protein